MESDTILRLLFVEDLETDQILTEREIKKAGIEFTSVRVETENDFIYQLEKFEPNIIISDYSMPEFDGMSALKIAQKIKPNIPFIIVTGSMNEDTAVECMKAGADDYIIKDNLKRLVPAIENVLKQAEIKRNELYVQEQLEKSEQKYRFLAENSVDVIWQMDLKLTFTYVSPSIYPMTGYKQEEWIGSKLYQHATKKEFIQMARRAYQSVKNYKTMQHVRFEAVMLKKDGSAFPVEINSKLLLNQNGIPNGLQGTTRDITERKKAEKALFESEHRFKSLFTDSLAVMLLIEPETRRIIDANSAAEKFYGWSKEELKKKKIEDINTLSLEEIKKEMHRAVAQQRVHFEFKHRRADGSVRDVEVFSSKIDFRNKSQLHSIIHDITERKKAENELISAKERAEKADQLKTEFLAQMSHEIRTPLNAVLSFSNLIEDEVSDYVNEELKVAFDGVQSASKRIIRTIDSILNMSELHLGTYELTISEINLVDLLKKLVKEFEIAAKTKNLELTFESSEEELFIKSDAYAINQIITNLVDNAVKYTKEGSVSLRLFQNDNRNYLIEVVDTGIGISKEYLPDIFTPFSQEEQGYSRKYDGTGLGMALVKKYSDIIGCNLSIESQKQVGTKIIIKFEDIG